LLKNLRLKIKNHSRGITLIEIIVVIFIIILFSLILIVDFPKNLRQFALKRVVYKLAQDIKETEDLSLSGVHISDKNGSPILLKGYGIYFFDPLSDSTHYLIYADVNNNQKYEDEPNLHNCGDNLQFTCCDLVDQTLQPLATDCVLEIVDISKENRSLSIEKFVDKENQEISGTGISINFIPPNPTIKITKDVGEPEELEYVGIVLKNTDNLTKKVIINIAGLINIEQ